LLIAILAAVPPTLPPGSIDTGRVVVRFEEADRVSATALSRLAEPTLDALCADFGDCPEDAFEPKLQVVVSDDMAGLRKALGPAVPAWAAGVAFPPEGVAGVRMDPRGGGWGEVERTFRHEMSHLLLHRIVAGRPVPRWFKEGFAMLQAREWSFDRARSLSAAALTDRLLDLDDLERRFPERRGEITLAYAQASAVVGHLLSSDPNAFARMLLDVRNGAQFDTALEHAYSTSIGQLEAQWRDALNTDYALIPLLTGGTSIWVLATLIFLVGYVRRRRSDRITLAQWEEEESFVAGLAE
jgi:hypothetical protein